MANLLIGPQISVAAGELSARLSALRLDIAATAAAAGRTEDSITLVAVGKGQPVERLAEAAALGVRHFGESYLQEALPKLTALGAAAGATAAGAPAAGAPAAGAPAAGAPAAGALVWHFIGRLQANKTRPVAEHFDWVHGVDRLKLAERLSAQRPRARAPLNVCIEVNIGAEPGKGGVDPAHLPELAAAVAELPGLALRGLMCLPPAGRAHEASRRAFHELHSLLVRLDAGRAALDTLSMGMSDDYRQAILEGATIVRIGTALFGARSASRGRAGADHAPGGDSPTGAGQLG